MILVQLYLTREIRKDNKKFGGGGGDYRLTNIIKKKNEKEKLRN